MDKHNWEVAITGLPYEWRFSSHRQYKTLIADCSKEECLKVLENHCREIGIKYKLIDIGAFGENIQQIGYDHEGVHDGSIVFGLLVRDDHEWYKK